MPTVLEVIKSTTAWFEKHGVESARLNAEHLMAHAFGKKKRLDLYMEFDRPLGESELAPLRDLVRQRAQGRPLQHLLGTVEFFGREFLSDSRALIPRPETEQLVEFVLQSKIQTTKPRERLGEIATGDPQGDTSGSEGVNPKSKILDVGTGSGIIAVTLALELPGSSVSAIDISEDALALARENAARLAANVVFEKGDLLPADPASFDLIVANLPYIPTADIASLAREVQHDPASALDGGTDGLDLVRKLIELAAPRLAAGGEIFLEIGHDQADRVAEIFGQHGYHDIRPLPDLQGVKRFVAAKKGPL